MRRSKTLAKIRAGKPVRLCALGHYLPFYVRHAAHNGYDCIWLDLEHRGMDPGEVQSLLLYAHRYDIDVMVRPATLEKTALYRYLEDGAAGLMIPQVNTPEMARQLVEYTRFPPLGQRGLDGAGMDADFYVAGGPDYPDAANRETFLVVQIESPQAVENVDAIAAVPGVDGLFVGPGDLGLRLRHPPYDTWKMEACFERVAAVAKNHGKAWGCPVPTADRLRQLAGQGGQLLAHGGEFFAIVRMLEQCGKDYSEL